MYRTRIEGGEPAPSDKVGRGHRPPPEPSCRPGADLPTDTRLLPRARSVVGRRGSLRDRRTARLAMRERLSAETVERAEVGKAGGRVVDPETGFDRVGDVGIDG